MKIARTTAFYVLLAWMLIGPLLRQGFELPSPWLRDWAMMHGTGINLIDARFYAVGPHGREELSLAKLMPSQQGRPALLKSEEDVLSTGRALCETLGAGADVRVVARVSTRPGWQDLQLGAENLCVTR